MLVWLAPAIAATFATAAVVVAARRSRAEARALQREVRRLSELGEPVGDLANRLRSLVEDTRRISVAARPGGTAAP